MSYTEYLQNPPRQSIVIYDCDQREIENIIQTLNCKKTTGSNSIPTDFTSPENTNKLPTLNNL